MSLKDVDKKIKSLFKEWKSLQPLKKEYRENLDQKIQFDWNFNSNRIEGNTLTYGQTKLLLLFGRYDGAHLERNYMEMKAHDVAINKVKEWAKDKKRKLTEIDIRDLNQIILKEAFWKKAKTPDGRETKKQIIPGRYKTQPNHVQTRTGKLFKFAEPWEVPAKMDELMKWFNKNLNTSSMASFISELHHRFIVIHPFDDGNGRVARLLINYALLYKDYLPLVIASNDKDNYIAALNKADTGDMDSLAKYLGTNLITWLETGIKAAKGHDIKEPSNIDKEVDLYIQHQKDIGLKLNDPAIFSKDSISKLCMDCLYPFFETFDEKFSCFSLLFRRKKISFIEYQVGDNESLKSFKKIMLVSEHIKNITEDESAWSVYLSKYRESNNKLKIDGKILYERFKDVSEKKEIPSFNITVDIVFIFTESHYEIQITQRRSELNIEKSHSIHSRYNEPWSEKNIAKNIATIKESFYYLIKDPVSF